MSYLLESQRGVLWIDSLSRPVRFWADLEAFVRGVPFADDRTLLMARRLPQSPDTIS